MFKVVVLFFHETVKVLESVWNNIYRYINVVIQISYGSKARCVEVMLNNHYYDYFIIL